MAAYPEKGKSVLMQHAGLGGSLMVCMGSDVLA